MRFWSSAKSSSPGGIPSASDSSVLDAIARAGGTTERANTEQIRLYAKGDLEAEQVLALGTDRLLSKES